jgi:hypothetical protein
MDIYIYIFIRGAKEVVANRVFCYSAKKKKKKGVLFVGIKGK